MGNWYRVQVPRRFNADGSRVESVQTAYIWANHEGSVASRLGTVPGEWRGISGTQITELDRERGQRVELAASDYGGLRKKMIKKSFLVWDDAIYGEPI